MTEPGDTGDLAFEGALDELEALVARLEAGDLVTVTRIDRLARSTFDLFAIVKQIVDAELLERAEQRIDELVRTQGGAAVRPFSAENAPREG